jgi:hypothetical protein
VGTLSHHCCIFWLQQTLTLCSNMIWRALNEMCLQKTKLHCVFSISFELLHELSCQSYQVFIDGILFACKEGLCASSPSFQHVFIE